MRNMIILKHQRGNHSVEHVYYHGTVVFEGNATDCKKEIASIKKDIRYRFLSECTNDKIGEYVESQMGVYFVIEKDEYGLHFGIL